MKLTKYSILIILIVIIFSGNLWTQNQGYNVPSRQKKEIKEQKVFVPDFEFMFSYSYHTNSGFFDKDGKLITDLPDSTSFPGVPLRYTFDLRRHTFDLDFKYFATEKLTLIAKAPITHYTLDEIYIEYFDPNTLISYPRGLRADFSHTRIDYIGLSAIYNLFDSKYINRYSAEIRIPTGTHDGVKNDPMEFWSDGALEITPGFIVGTSTEKLTFEIGAKYNYRGEDMTDRVIGNLNFALHTVPGTRFYGLIEGALNVNMKGHDVIEDIFDIRRMPWQDEYLDAGFGFKFVVEDHYIGDFSYRVRIVGRNAWNHAAYFINFGYRF
ncbi:MAG: hypothetical protein KIT33_01995 [Candidatus Kapabacteria bacterium]|nr:hypothetical protein [Ignavibacteriota bacterium]MCW5883724.1 hypothetical protein [Candidatus Kapabacteria bacterium]